MIKFYSKCSICYHRPKTDHKIMEPYLDRTSCIIIYNMTRHVTFIFRVSKIDMSLIVKILISTYDTILICFSQVCGLHVFVRHHCFGGIYYLHSRNLNRVLTLIYEHESKKKDFALVCGSQLISANTKRISTNSLCRAPHYLSFLDFVSLAKSVRTCIF